MKVPKGIITHSGRVIDLKNINPDDILIEDIAWGLSMTNRWGGQCNEPYSIAQHSMAVARMCNRQDKLAGLMHDASEAYICDMPSPAKILLPDYHELEKKLMGVISEKFEFQYPMSLDVKAVDKLMAQIEYTDLMLGEDDNDRTDFLTTKRQTQREVYDGFMKMYEAVQFSIIK